MSAGDVPPPPRQRPGDTQQSGGAAGLVDSVKVVAADLAALVRAELDFAKAEVAQGAQRKALGAGLLLVGIGLVGVAFLALLVAAGFALTEGAGLPGWASALIIAGALLLAAVILALVGRRQLASPVSTTTTQQRLSEDVEWLTQRIKESR